MAVACCFDFGSDEDRRQSLAISSARGTLRRNLGPALPELGVREAFFVSAEGDGVEARFLDAVVGEVMDEAFPVVDAGQHVESVQKLLSKATPAVLVRRSGAIEGIVTRSDMLAYLMVR